MATRIHFTCNGWGLLAQHVRRVGLDFAPGGTSGQHHHAMFDKGRVNRENQSLLGMAQSLPNFGIQLTTCSFVGLSRRYGRSTRLVRIINASMVWRLKNRKILTLDLGDGGCVLHLLIPTLRAD